MVECTALEMRHTCKGIVGSNPTLSAITFVPKLFHSEVEYARHFHFAVPGQSMARCACLSCARSEPTLSEKCPAGGQIIQNAAGIARVALLFDGDVAAVAKFRQKAADGWIVD